MINGIYSDFKSSIEQATKFLKSDLSKLRTGRANLAILDDVRVDYYGTPTPINQVASMAVSDARLITIKPWDRSVIGLIEKAIMAADVGITPQNAGDVIRLPVPSLTEERRRDLAKQAKNRGEEAKLAIRNGRRDANDMLKELAKDGDISEDDRDRALAKIQEFTDEAIKQIDAIVKEKENEIMED